MFSKKMKMSVIFKEGIRFILIIILVCTFCASQTNLTVLIRYSKDRVFSYIKIEIDLIFNNIIHDLSVFKNEIFLV